MTDYRKRLEAVAADLAKYDDDCTLARAYGGPTMLPRHPIDERRASQIGADLRSLLSEAESLRADITGLEDGNMTFMCDQLDKAKAENVRLRSLVDEAGRVVEGLMSLAMLDEWMVEPEREAATAHMEAARSLLPKLKGEGQ